MSNYPPGVTDNDPYFDMPSVGDEEEDPTCGMCGRDLDEELHDFCLDCANQLKRDADEAKYWKEVNRTAYITSQYNNGSR